MFLNKKSKILSADFIRTLAIVFVVFYHFFPTIVPNGWLGVDLFFVLSGFLLIDLVQSQSLGKFLHRRLYRIIVPLSVFSSLVAPLSFLLFKSDFWLDVIVYPNLSALFGFGNIYFFLFQDYFNKLAYQPFLHLWSLGVEMQFVLIVAVLSLIAKRHALILSVFAIGFLSFCANYFFSDLTAQFYLTPFRLYEFIVGCFARMLYQKTISDRLPGFLSRFIGFLALAGLLVLVIGLIGVNRFEASNLAIIFTFLLMVFGGLRGCGTFFSKVASRSYSIYLIHYPYAFFSKTLALSVYEIFLVVVLSLISAEIFYRLVDLKVQNKVFNVKSLKWPVSLSITALSAMLIIWPLNNVVSSEELNASDSGVKEVNMLALGDSHLPHAQLFLEEIDVSVDYADVNCLPVPNTTHVYAVTDFSQKNHKCSAQNALWGEKYSDYDVILLAARWSYPFIGEVNKSKVLNQWTYETRLVRSDMEAAQIISIEESKRIFEAEMHLLASQMAERGQVLILFGEVPPLGSTPTGCERLTSFFSRFCNRHFFTKSEALITLSYTTDFFIELASTYSDNVVYIDLANSFCPKTAAFCINQLGDFFIYSDDNHLNYQKLLGNKDFFDQAKDVKGALRLVLEE